MSSVLKKADKLNLSLSLHKIHITKIVNIHLLMEKIPQLSDVDNAMCNDKLVMLEYVK